MTSSSGEEPVRVCIACPTDPVGSVAGGIDPFVRGVVRYAPPDMEFSVIGATTAANERPVGRWMNCRLGQKSFAFFPVIELEDRTRESKVPISLRYTMALFARRRIVDCDVIEFHEIEPCIGFLLDKRPKNVIIHTNMNAIRDQSSSVRWRHFPWLYFLLERLLMSRMSSVFCVRSDAVEDYQDRYPHLADRFRFTPTWMDTSVFSAPSNQQRIDARSELRRRFEFPSDSSVFVSVGRLSREKNPEMLFRAFIRVLEKTPSARLLYLGEGSHEKNLRKLIGEHALQSYVVLAGGHSPSQVAGVLWGADVFVLSSEFEGMPISLLESLSCGLPATVTDVGEVRRVVSPGVNGEIVSVYDHVRMAQSMTKCLENADRYRGDPCVKAVQAFTPEKVLQPIYENYRRLAQLWR